MILKRNRTTKIKLLLYAYAGFCIKIMLKINYIIIMLDYSAQIQQYNRNITKVLKITFYENNGFV